MAKLLCVLCGTEGAAPVPLVSGEFTEPVCSPNCAGLLLLQRATVRDLERGRPWPTDDLKQLGRLIRFERLVTSAARFLRISRGPLAMEHAGQGWAA